MNNEKFKENQTSPEMDLSDLSGLGGTFHKAKDTQKTVKALLSYSKKHLAVIIMAVISAIAGTVIALISPEKLKDMTNLITEGIMTYLDMSGFAKI